MKKNHSISLNYEICVTIFLSFSKIELCRLRSATEAEIEPELEVLRHEMSLISESQSSWTMKTVWDKKSLRWPVICVFVMHFGNQLSGINAVFYYSTDIFESAGFDKQQAEY